MTVADIMTVPTSATAAAIAAEGAHTARNYAPLPVVATSARGAWITDVEGRRYLDCLAAYPRSTSVITTTRSLPQPIGNSTD